MEIKIFLISFISILTFPVFLYAQQTQIPKSPEAALLGKFIDIPVGISTGIPTISIPLHEIKAGSLTLPIEMSYHAGGIRVNEQSTAIGLGWALSTDLEITRNIQGQDDLSPTLGYIVNNLVGPFIDYYTTQPVRTLQQKKDVADGTKDERPDKFQYKLLGKSGTFYVQKFSNGSYKFVTVPFNNLKILAIPGGFKIVDTDGTIYRFGTALDGVTNIDYTLGAPVTAWKCTEIVNPEKNDTVFFKYIQKSDRTTYSYPEQLELYDSARVNNCCMIFTYPVPYYDVRTSSGSRDRSQVYKNALQGGVGAYYYTMNDAGNPTPDATVVSTLRSKTLQEIRFRTGRVEFYGIDKLDSLKILDDKLQNIKTIIFFQSYVVSQFDNRRYLDSIKIGNAAAMPQNYQFDYDKVAIPAYTKGGDAWGFYNTRNGNPSNYPITVPQQTFNSWYEDGTANPPVAVHFPIGSGDIYAYGNTGLTLKTLYYPTGGRTEFKFSANKYLNINNVLTNAGGLRVDTIKYYTNGSATSAFEKIYKYGTGENGAGTLVNIPSVNGINGVYTNQYNYEQAVHYFKYGGAISQHLGTYRKRTYLGSSLQDFSFSSAPVLYQEVAEYQKDGGVVTGKTVYQFDLDLVDNGGCTSCGLPGTPLSIKRADWFIGKIKTQAVYKYNGGGYQWVNQKNYTYQKYNRPEQIYVGQAFKHDIMVPDPMDPNFNSDAYENISYNYYGIEVGEMLPFQLTESQQDNGGNIISQITTNYYDNLTAHLHPTRIQTVKSNGVIVTNYITYPQDYSGGTPFIDSLVSNNRTDLPIEKVTVQTDINGTNILSGQISTFKIANMSVFPDQIYKLETSKPIPLASFKFSNQSTGHLPFSTSLTLFSMDPVYYKPTLNFNQFDNRGNILTLTPANAPPQSYLWDYNNQYSITEVINAIQVDIAYTSFEADGTGNWTIGSTSRNTSGFSGRQSYNLSNGNLSKSSLSSSKLYIISYWTTNISPFTIIGTVSGYPVKGSTINGWTYYEHQVLGLTSATLSGSGNIDEVRLYPKDAQMTTYTYAPLIGMTSSVSPKNEITYYEYDNFQRLMNIKDQYGNIIKHMDYQYKGQ